MCGDMIVNELYSYNNAQIIMPKSFWDIKLGILQNIAKYDGVGKREIIDRYISDKELCDTEKDVIIGAFDLKKQRPKFFKSWGKDKIGIRDAIDISSAAPCYFKPVKFGILMKLIPIHQQAHPLVDPLVDPLMHPLMHPLTYKIRIHQI